jgi:glycosyltransferase involved in cell wall biosynthesis
MKVSLVVPIYNEAPHLREFLELLDALTLPCEKELVFVDDCSRDDSYAILTAFQFRSAHQIKRQPANAGKGAALREGFALATGDIIGVQDADFEYSLADVPDLVIPLLENKADVVFGSRFKKNAPQVHRTFHYIVNRLLTIISNLLSGIYLTDMETCYKFFRAEILKNLKLESNRFGFEPEITAKIARLKLRMVELPISYFPRTYLDGKKITWKDGIAALRHLIVFNLMRKAPDYVLPSMPKKYQAARSQWL